MSQHLISVNPRERLIDRELSWLAFNERVLELAEDQSNPLLERCRYLAIFSSNLDDFYMIRVATCKRKVESGVTKKNTAGYAPFELLADISKKTQELISRQTKCFHEDLMPKLKQNGIEITDWDKLSSDEIEYINKIFTKRIFPVLTPLAVDPSHPFPYISGLSLNLAVLVKQPETNEELFASTYKSAADKLMAKGHRKRAAELMKMHDFRKSEEEQEKLRQEEMRKNKIVENAAQLGVYKCKVRFSKEEFVGDFYLNLTFAEYLFEDDYTYFLDGESGMYLGFAIGVIPANEESKEWIEKVGKGFIGGDKVTYWMGDLRLKASNVQNIYHMGDFTEAPTSGYVYDEIYESGIDDEAVIIYYNSNTRKRYRFDKENDKWIGHYLEFAPDGNMFFEIHEGDFHLADRKSAIQFKSKFYDIFSGKIIFRPDPNLDHVKDMMLECICNEYGHSIHEFLSLIHI